MKRVYIIAAFMAVIVAVAVYLFSSSLKQNVQTPAQSMKNVVVTQMQIPANTEIKEEMVKLETLPVSAVNPSSISDIEQVVGMISKDELIKGEQVLSPRIVKKGQEDGALSYTLEDGKRAVSIGVDDVSGVSGYIQKGDYVDVIATVLTKDATGQSISISTSLVENLLVLEAGIKPIPGNPTTGNYTTITLSATPEEALKINYAASNGKLRLLLRAVLDNKNVNPPNFPNLSTPYSNNEESKGQPLVSNPQPSESNGQPLTQKASNN